MKDTSEIKISKIEFFFLMFKIGIISFGGGNALIPVMYDALINKGNIIEDEQFEENVVVANISPGALPVEVASGIGSQLFGWKGMILGAVGVALPGAILTIIMFMCISFFTDMLQRQFSFAVVGVISFIICILIESVFIPIANLERKEKEVSIAIMLVVFLLTGSQKICKLFGMDVVCLFDLSSITVFLFLFIPILVCETFSFMKGKTRVIEKISFGQTGREIFAIFVFLGVFALPLILTTENAGKTLGNGIISSLLSFGGGDAYLTVADSFFVSNGLVDSSIFYGEIVPIVNILPGSFLCKILTAVGYFVGFQETGSNLIGGLEAIAGFSCGVAGSCFSFSLIKYVYKCFKNLVAFDMIKKYIKPLVSGLMLTVMVSLLNQVVMIGVKIEMEKIILIILVMTLIIDGCLFFRYKKKKGFILLMSIIVSTILCNGMLIL